MYIMALEVVAEYELYLLRPFKPRHSHPSSSILTKPLQNRLLVEK
jgi:hypothetical protein